MCEVALSECHKETDTLDTLDIECERFKLLVVQKVHILLADLLKVVLSLYLHRLGFYPLAVLDITALCGYLTDIYLGVEVCRKRVTVVATVAVENINVIDFIKVMLLGIGDKTLVTPGSNPLPRSAVMPAFSNFSLYAH